MGTDEVADGRPSWDQRMGLAQPPAAPIYPVERAGIDVDDVADVAPADPRAIELYRKSILEAAASGAAIPDEEVLARAGRTPHDATIDLETASKRFKAIAAIAAAQLDIEKAAELAATPRPRGALLKTLAGGTVADLLDAIDAYRRALADHDANPPGVSLRASAQHSIEKAEMVLLETCDPSIDREVDGIRRDQEILHRRLAHWSPVLQEAAELDQLPATLKRLGQGVLTEAERVYIDHDRMAEAVVPGAKEKHASLQQRSDQQRISDLLSRGRARLELLKARRSGHVQARRETDAAEAELLAGTKRINELLASKRRPERMRWQA